MSNGITDAGRRDAVVVNRSVLGPLSRTLELISQGDLIEAARAAYARATAGFDAVLCPTAPILPPHAQRLLDDADYYKAENLLALRNTRVANLMDLPAVTLPTGTPSCGIMLCGHTGQDDRLLRVAAVAEAALA